jgi:hypothetical protein
MARLLTRIHGRQRAELRTNISAAVATRERHLQEGRLGKVIKSILGTEQNRFEYAALHTKDGILTEPTEIHNKVAEHFQEWFSSPKRLITEYTLRLRTGAASSQTRTGSLSTLGHGQYRMSPHRLSGKPFDSQWRTLGHANSLTDLRKSCAALQHLKNSKPVLNMPQQDLLQVSLAHRITCLNHPQSMCSGTSTIPSPNSGTTRPYRTGGNGGSLRPCPRWQGLSLLTT